MLVCSSVLDTKGVHISLAHVCSLVGCSLNVLTLNMLSNCGHVMWSGIVWCGDVEPLPCFHFNLHIPIPIPISVSPHSGRHVSAGSLLGLHCGPVHGVPAAGLPLLLPQHATQHLPKLFFKGKPMLCLRRRGQEIV